MKGKTTFQYFSINMSTIVTHERGKFTKMKTFFSNELSQRENKFLTLRVSLGTLNISTKFDGFDFQHVLKFSRNSNGLETRFNIQGFLNFTR